jgi:hypothetical protein
MIYENLLTSLSSAYWGAVVTPEKLKSQARQLLYFIMQSYLMAVSTSDMSDGEAISWCH